MEDEIKIGNIFNTLGIFGYPMGNGIRGRFDWRSDSLTYFYIGGKLERAWIGNLFNPGSIHGYMGVGTRGRYNWGLCLSVGVNIGGSERNQDI